MSEIFTEQARKRKQKNELLSGDIKTEGHKLELEDEEAYIRYLAVSSKNLAN